MLKINGRRLDEIVTLCGTTPLYIYDRSFLHDRIDMLRSSFSANIAIHYAVKANPMPALLSEMAKLVDGFDVASHGELIKALNAGVAPKNIGFAGPGKRDFELRAAIASGACISVESKTELDRCGDIAGALSVQARICLRINPSFELKTSGMKMTGRSSQFGIDVDQVSDILASGLPAYCGLVGLQIFSGSQSLVAQALSDTFVQALAVCEELSVRHELELDFVNVGGGLGIPYFPKEKPLNLSAIAPTLNKVAAKFKSKFPSVDVIVELGRFLVGEAGYFITRVVDIKRSRGKTFVIVDGGLHNHLANSGNFGQVIRKNYPVVVGNKVNAENNILVDIVGPLCTPLDVVAKDITIPAPEFGDLIVIKQSGAYGLSASPVNFLGHPTPPELLI